MIAKCKAAEIFGDPASEALLEEYAEECAIALVGKPAPRLDMYEGMERSGFGQCFAVRQDGKLVGFAMVLICVVPHYDLCLANVESLFVARGAQGGRALMSTLNEYAKESGCTSIFYTAPVGSRLARLLFLCADDYVNTNHVFCRRLK